MVTSYLIQSVHHIDYYETEEVKAISNRKERNKEAERLGALYEENLRYATPDEFMTFFSDIVWIQWVNRWSQQTHTLINTGPTCI